MVDYFKRPVHQIIVTRPLEVSKVLNSYDVKCSVKGGGLSGQAIFFEFQSFMMKNLLESLKISLPPEILGC